MDLSDIVRSLRRHWRISAGIMLAAVLALGVFLVTREQVRPEDRYQSTVQVLIPARDEDGVRPEGVPPGLLQGQESLALADTTLGNAFRGAGVEPGSGDVEFDVSQNETFDIMYLSAEAGNEELARRASDSFAAAYMAARSNSVGSGARSGQQSATTAITLYSRRVADIERQLRAQNVPLPEVVSPSESRSGESASPNVPIPPGASANVALLLFERNRLLTGINQARARYADLSVNALTPSSYAEVVERSGPTRVTPPAPSPILPTALALGAGLLLAVAVPVLKDRFDSSVQTARTAAALFEVPVLTSIPPTSRSQQASLAAPGSMQDAAYRSLAATSVSTDRLPRAIMVTSPVGDSHDSVAANFATSLAGLGLRVALIATSTRQGWFLDGTTPSANGVQPVPMPDLPHLLQLAASGRLNGTVGHQFSGTGSNPVVVPPGTSEEMSLPLDGLPPLLEQLADSKIDVTVIAGPALLEDPNATIFAWATRSVLWAVKAGEVSKAEAQEAASRLVLAGVTPFGVAMIGRES